MIYYLKIHHNISTSIIKQLSTEDISRQFASFYYFENYNFIMIKPKSRTKSSLINFAQKPSTQNLVPIYSKVELLKKELEFFNKQQAESSKIEQYSFGATWKNHFMDIGIDRNSQIEKQRKNREVQSKIIPKEKNTNKDQHLVSTATSWRDHNRNKTKSLINFLAQNKDFKTRAKTSSKKTNENNELQKDDNFEPVGQQYKKQKLIQESMKTQTQSLTSSRHQSLQSSSALGLRKQSSKKYLRKGTRVRQIIMRQLQTPEERGSSASTLTYLKDYDQWVPNSVVQQKKQQLETFMNIMFGGKKNQNIKAVNLNAIELIYL